MCHVFFWRCTMILFVSVNVVARSINGTCEAAVCEFRCLYIGRYVFANSERVLVYHMRRNLYSISNFIGFVAVAYYSYFYVDPAVLSMSHAYSTQAYRDTDSAILFHFFFSPSLRPLASFLKRSFNKTAQWWKILVLNFFKTRCHWHAVRYFAFFLRILFYRCCFLIQKLDRITNDATSL